MTRAAFGPNLRRTRIARGISLDTIAHETKVPVDLWEAMERNDFSAWPAGVYARAYIRDYARTVGLDPDSTVDEFCRWFPQGDRRTERLIREQAEIVGHETVWTGDKYLGGAAQDRRAGAPPAKSPALAARVAGALFAAAVRAGRALRRVGGDIATFGRTP